MGHAVPPAPAALSVAHNVSLGGEPSPRRCSTLDELVVVAIPGGKGLVILPRLGISEVSKSVGQQSRWTNLRGAAPLLFVTGMTAALPTLEHGPHWAALRNQKYALIGLGGLLIGERVARTPPERWVPVFGWLYRGDVR